VTSSWLCSRCYPYTLSLSLPPSFSSGRLPRPTATGSSSSIRCLFLARFAVRSRTVRLAVFCRPRCLPIVTRVAHQSTHSASAMNCLTAFAASSGNSRSISSALTHRDCALSRRCRSHKNCVRSMPMESHVALRHATRRRAGAAPSSVRDAHWPAVHSLRYAAALCTVPVYALPGSVTCRG